MQNNLKDMCLTIFIVYQAFAWGTSVLFFFILILNYVENKPTWHKLAQCQSS